MSAITLLKTDFESLPANELALKFMSGKPLEDLISCIDYESGKVMSDRVSYLHLAVDMSGEFAEQVYSFHNKVELEPHLRQFLTYQSCEEVLNSFNFKEDKSFFYN